MRVKAKQTVKIETELTNKDQLRILLGMINSTPNRILDNTKETEFELEKTRDNLNKVEMVAGQLYVELINKL